MTIEIDCDFFTANHKMYCPVEYIEYYKSHNAAHFIRELVGLFHSLESIKHQSWRVLQQKDINLHFGVLLSLMELCNVSGSPRIITLICCYPTAFLQFIDESLIELQEQLLLSYKKEHNLSLEGEGSGLDALSVKHYVHGRIIDFPLCSSLIRDNVSSIRARDVGSLLQLSGTVVRTNSILMLEWIREYRCSKCGTIFNIHNDMDSRDASFDIPKQCPYTGPRGGKCKNNNFVLNEQKKIVRDYQKIKIQEQVQKLNMGSIPRSILVVLTDDLVDTVKAGDDVEIIGLVRQMWNNNINLQFECKIDMEIYIEAISIITKNDAKATITITDDTKHEYMKFWAKHTKTPLLARNYIVSQICPSLYGLFIPKLSLLLTLIGGVAKIEAHGTKVRGESHLLIVGDPGTGKSQLLKYAAQVASRSVLTTGMGTTSAGLTVSAVKDSTSGEWILEAGALVLADGGICCIDEFGCIRESDRGTIHEAMEQQTLSVAKAGLVCTLNARTAVFAVLNPKGNYDKDAELSVNTAIASPLLSRFDIILLLLDNQNDSWDQKVANYILNSLEKPLEEEVQIVTKKEFRDNILQSRKQQPHGNEQNDPMHVVDQSDSNKEEQTTAQTNSTAASTFAALKWPLEKVQSYIFYVKNTFEPKLTQWSELVLVRYYTLHRDFDHPTVTRTTIRLLESLIRLSQAHARLMFRNIVLAFDAIQAVLLMESTVYTCSIIKDVKFASGDNSFGTASSMHQDFDSDADAHFSPLAQTLLQRLNISSIPYEEIYYDYAAQLAPYIEEYQSQFGNPQPSLIDESFNLPSQTQSTKHSGSITTPAATRTVSPSPFAHLTAIATAASHLPTATTSMSAASKSPTIPATQAMPSRLQLPLRSHGISMESSPSSRIPSGTSQSPLIQAACTGKIVPSHSILQSPSTVAFKSQPHLCPDAVKEDAILATLIPSSVPGGSSTAIAAASPLVCSPSSGNDADIEADSPPSPRTSHASALIHLDTLKFRGTQISTKSFATSNDKQFTRDGEENVNASILLPSPLLDDIADTVAFDPPSPVQVNAPPVSNPANVPATTQAAAALVPSSDKFLIKHVSDTCVSPDSAFAKRLDAELAILKEEMDLSFSPLSSFKGPSSAFSAALTETVTVASITESQVMAEVKQQSLVPATAAAAAADMSSFFAPHSSTASSNVHTLSPISPPALRSVLSFSKSDLGSFTDDENAAEDDLSALDLSFKPNFTSQKKDFQLSKSAANGLPHGAVAACPAVSVNVSASSTHMYDRPLFPDDNVPLFSFLHTRSRLPLADIDPAANTWNATQNRNNRP